MVWVLPEAGLGYNNAIDAKEVAYGARKSLAKLAQYRHLDRYGIRTFFSLFHTSAVNTSYFSFPFCWHTCWRPFVDALQNGRSQNIAILFIYSCSSSQ